MDRTGRVQSSAQSLKQLNDLVTDYFNVNQTLETSHESQLFNLQTKIGDLKAARDASKQWSEQHEMVSFSGHQV